MEARWRELSDDLGPAKILLVRNAAAGLEGVVVVDNVAAGPAIGGVRMARDVTVEEVVRLAEERQTARAGRDFGRADELRQQIEGLGWEVQDVSEGYRLIPSA